MDDLFAPLMLSRGLHLAALGSAFGCLCFAVLLRGPMPRGLFRSSIAIAIVLGLIWLAVQSVVMADAADARAALAAIPAVAGQTRFGQALLARLGLMAAAWLCVSRGWRIVALILLVPAIAVEAAFSHAGAGIGYAAPLIEALHLLAAAAWLGGLVPLRQILSAPGAEAIGIVRRFSVLGIAAVSTIAATAAWQAWLLVGGIPGLVGTTYGLVCLLKLALFAGLVGLAALNRQRLTPALGGAQPDRARALLRETIGIEIALGLGAVLAAAALALLPPGAHEQPVWPFAHQISWASLDEPALRGEALLGLGLATSALVLALRATVWRRWRWPTLASGILAAILAWPHLDLFFVPAYPTSFYLSPTGFTAESIAAGRVLFEQHCVDCHGNQGRGDGRLAAKLAVPPADLTAGHLWEHPDGELFWWLSHGIDGPEGGLAMPGFAASLSQDEIWTVLDFVHANGAGQNTPPHPVAAPELAAACGAQWLGKAFLRVVLDDRPQPPSYDQSELPVIMLRRHALAQMGGLCVATDPDAWIAYSVLAGAIDGDGQGAQLVIDPQGRVRAHWRPGEAPDWNEPGILLALTIKLRAQAIGEPVPSGHAHHH